jgi:hypothetical protein
MISASQPATWHKYTRDDDDKQQQHRRTYYTERKKRKEEEREHRESLMKKHGENFVGFFSVWKNKNIASIEKANVEEKTHTHREREQS